ncbi:GlsB/YeaQ/YmgE family stress response membrane protein, partial [Pantoea stewartii]
SGHGSSAEQNDKGRNARKCPYCLKLCPATGTLAPNLIYSTKPFGSFVVAVIGALVVLFIYRKVRS